MSVVQKHNSNADGLRGIACIAVLFSHLAYTFYPYMHAAESMTYSFESYIMNSPFSFFYSGSAGVYIFFVLSGFVLSSSFSKNFGASYFPVFLIKRYIRLMIPIFASCILGWYLFSTFTIDRTGISAWAAKLGTFDYSFQDAIYTGLVGAFQGKGIEAYNWVLWTMKIELIGSYALALLFISKKTNSVIYPLLAFILFFAIGYSNGGDSLYYGLACFMAGSVIFKSEFKLSKAGALLALIIGLYFAGYKVQSMSYSFIFRETNTYLMEYSLFLLSGILVVLCSLRSTLLDNILSAKITVLLGKISFSLYLIQMATIYTVAIPLYEMLSHKTTPLSASFIAIISCTVVSLPLSWVFYKLFDLPAMLLSNKISFMLLRLKTTLFKECDRPS